MLKTNATVRGFSCIALLALLGVGCGSEPDAKSPDGDGASTSGTSEASSAPSSEAGSSSSGSATTSSEPTKSSASAAASSGPSKSSSEVAKDPSALVLEMKFAMKGGGKVDAATSGELQKAALEHMKKSQKLASPDAKVEKPRRVMVTVMVDEPTSNAKGLTIKMGLVGVEPDGKCPLFDLEQNFTMSGAKSTNADDVLSLRKSAIDALLTKLEETAPTLKPTANCTGFKGPKG